MNKISFHDTHVYPGCLATIRKKVAPDGSTAQVAAEFSDGSIAMAEFEQLNPDEVLIRIDAYTTGRGTRIPEKAWLLRCDNALDIWKVVARM